MTSRVQWLADEILPHEPELRRWLWRRLPAGMEVDDVVQEAYAELAGLADVTAIRSPRAYLFTTARSVILQQLRRARIVSFETVADLDRLVVDEATPGPERQAVVGEELRWLAAVIDALPGKCRQAFVLRKLHGLSQRAIAARMGISENTVEKHIAKGLRALVQGSRDEMDSRRDPAGATKRSKHEHANQSHR